MPPDLLQEIGNWYFSEGHKYMDDDATLYIESRWGSIIVEDICIPRSMAHGECLIIILDLCKEKYAPAQRPGNRPSDPPSWRKP